MKVYATTDAGDRVLVKIVCDDCGAEMRPNPDIANSGWVKHGWSDGGQNYESHHCEKESTDGR